MGIFSNDDACDVRDTYFENLFTLRDEDAEALTIKECEGLEEFNPGSLWIALALTEWKYGRLSPKVKSAALAAIDKELCSEGGVWKSGLENKRREVLCKAAAQLETPMPKRKKISMPSWAWKCPWQVGDILQYKIHAPAQAFKELEGKYVLLPIIAISSTPDGKIPCEALLVGLYNWMGLNPPRLEEIVNINFSAFRFPSGNTRTTMSISLDKRLIRDADIKCIGTIPRETIESYYGVIDEVPAPSDAFFLNGICVTFSSDEKSL